MKTNQLLYEQVNGRAKIGQLKDTNKLIPDIPLSQLVPYVASSEDIEVLLDHSNFLRENQPVEFNGFATHQILTGSDKYQETFFGGTATYPRFIKNHPSLMSFPSELLWLTNNEGLRYFDENIKWILQRKCIGFDKSKAEKISEKIINLIRDNRESFSFWSEIKQRYESELLSTLLMVLTIELANYSRMRYLSGLVPIIDYNSKTSHSVAFNANIAYASIIEDRRDHGLQTPKYFYTICLNQNMIQRIDFELLNTVISDVKRAMSQPIFDGIFVSVRGLSKISNEESRVILLSKFMSEINKISEEESIPVWYSNFGLIGLNILDAGGSFASYHLNLYKIDDVYSTFSSNNRNRTDVPKHGRVFNRTDGCFYDANQLKRFKQSKRALHQYPDFPNQPTDYQLEHDTLCRKEFIKPYNILTMDDLNKEWLEKTKIGDSRNPGKEFLIRCRDPSYYNIWGS